MNIGSILRAVQMTCLLCVLLFLVSSCGTTEGHGSRVGISRFGSADHIRNRVLKYTPIGSTYGEVHEFVQYRLKYKYGPYYENVPASRPSGDRYESVGVRNINLFLGDYGFPGFPLVMTPKISWAFDKNDKLIDVIVLKERESL